MEELYNEFMNSISNWQLISPEQIQKFIELLQSTEKQGSLDQKTKELISVALSVYAQCQYCIAFHVKNAVELGAKAQEIREAAWVAVAMGGGPKLAYMQFVEKAIKEFAKE